MELLNTLNLHKCETEEQQEQHNTEVIEFFDSFGASSQEYLYKRYCTDEGHKHGHPFYFIGDGSEYADAVEGADIKDGVDIYKDGRKFVVVAFGQGYTFKDDPSQKYYQIITHIEAVKVEDATEEEKAIIKELEEDF